jgi:hypothetical protein
MGFFVALSIGNNLRFTIYDLRFTIYDLRFTIWDLQLAYGRNYLGASQYGMEEF